MLQRGGSMNSSLLSAARIFGAISIGVIVLSAMGLLLGGASGPARHPIAIIAAVLLVYWLAEPLIGRRALRAQATALLPVGAAASDQSQKIITFEVTEREWIEAKLVYRGVHTIAGVARRIVLALPIVSLLYFVLAWFTARLPGAAAIAPFRDPGTAAGIIVALAALFTLIDNVYRAPLMAAAVYRANAARWWPATIAWDDAAIFIENAESRFRYALGECRGWKESPSLILLYSPDDRYWCLPKQALDEAGRLGDFREVLAAHVPALSPYQIVYRHRRQAL